MSALFRANGSFVLGPKRSGSSRSRIVFELPSIRKADMTAENLNALMDDSKRVIEGLLEGTPHSREDAERYLARFTPAKEEQHE